MDNEENIDKILENIIKEWGFEKPGHDKNPEFEKLYKCLRNEGLEKYTKLKYPYTRGLDGSDNLAGKVSMATDNNKKVESIGLHKTVEYVNLYISNITGDYKAEIKLKKPKDFEFKEFKEKIYRDIPSTKYMYKSKAFVTNVREDNKYAYVKADLLIKQMLRLINLLGFIKENQHKVGLVIDLCYN